MSLGFAAMTAGSTNPGEPEGGHAAPSVSLIIPVRNEATRIGRCLANLQAQTLRPKEILVVDGHSTDATVEIASRYGVRLLLEDYGTRGGAVQVGIDHAEGEFVAFTDADCLPEPRWLETLASKFAPGIAGVGGRVVNEGDRFIQRSIDVALNTVLGSANSVQGRAYTEPRFVSSISGCNSMYRREDVRAVGGLDPSLVTTEDTELNRRLQKRGRLLYVPDAVVHHRHGRGLRDFARRMFQYGFGRGQSLLLGPMLAAPFGAAALLLLLYLVPGWALWVLTGYAAACLFAAAWAAVRERDARFLGALPLVFVIEHAAYVAGFWYGAFRSRLVRGRRSRGFPEDAS